MVKAVQLDIDGNDIIGTERDFGDKHWNFMQERYGKYLRWRSIAEKAVEKKVTIKEKQTKDEKTNLPAVDGGSDAAVAI